VPQVTRSYRWYVLYTRCKHEVAAERYLNRCGIETYLPMHRILKQRADRKIWLNVPVFRSYIFAKVSCREYVKALQDFSIVGYVKIEGFPCPVTDEQIKAIKEILIKDVEFEVTGENFVPGDEVVIQSGLLAGCSAEVVERAGKKEVILRLKGTNQSMLITAPVNYVIKNGLP
jgi:transcriptional antiterminator RfaH